MSFKVSLKIFRVKMLKCQSTQLMAHCQLSEKCSLTAGQALAAKRAFRDSVHWVAQYTMHWGQTRLSLAASQLMGPSRGFSFLLKMTWVPPQSS